MSYILDLKLIMSNSNNYNHDNNLNNEYERRKISEMIYQYAKDGMCLVLVSILNDIKDENLRKILLNQTFDEPDGQSFTPLAVAATNGKDSVVKILLSNYNVDLESECIVKFDGHIVKGVSPLWCAASSGHLKIVKLLIKSGANVNHRTKAQSTPLRAACFEGRLDIVQYLITHGADVQLANSFNNTCLMISSYKGFFEIVEYLLAAGANPNEQALCGATALHYAAECGHISICNILLEFGAVLKNNEYGLTPVLTAAERTNDKVVELFVNKCDLLTKKEKIDAYELLGASFANDKDNYSIDKAHNYLVMGMELRYKDPENLIKKQFTASVPAYDNWIESQNMQDLQAIRLNHNSIHMESLAIRERILGKTYPDLPQPIVFRGAIFADHRRFDRCESLWVYALQLRQNKKASIERDLLRFAQLYSQMLHLGLNLNLSNVLEVVECAVIELQMNKKIISDPGPKDDPEIISYEFEQNTITTLYLITIITKILKCKSQKFQTKDLNNLYKLIYKITKFNPKLRDGQSILHLAVNGITPIDNFHTNDICRFPDYDTVKLLIHCGACVTEIDCDRNTPLHTLTSTVQINNHRNFNERNTIIENIIKLFIDAGVHLDAINGDGLTASKVASTHVIERLVKQYEMQSISLKCLSSRCIALNKLNYRGNVPKNLESFIQMHSAEKL